MKIMSAPTMVNSYNLNNQNQNRIGKSYSDNRNSISFKGDESKFFKPLKDLYEIMTDKMAIGMVKALQTKPAKWYIEKTAKLNMVAHYTAFTSAVLSGFYIKQTLQNDKLDDKKKKTLAINQGATCVLSTVLAYIADKSINNKINEITNKYTAVNIENATKKTHDNWVAGFKAAKTIIVFGMIYRFITPVFVTPIANHIGNKLDEKEKAQKKIVA